MLWSIQPRFILPELNGVAMSPVGLTCTHRLVIGRLSVLVSGFGGRFSPVHTTLVVGWGYSMMFQESGRFKVGG
jgi:hypothetical protein